MHQQGLMLCFGAGNFSSFLFQLLPSVAVYPASGVNQNFQYCGHNFAALPNGIGYGGQVGKLCYLVCIFYSGMSLYGIIWPYYHSSHA